MKIAKKFRQSESGDIGIEALLGLVFFILAFMGVLMFSTLMQLQAKTQYAANQTAKEVSQYFYVIDRMGLLPSKPFSTANPSNANQLIQDGEKFGNALTGFFSNTQSAASSTNFDQLENSLGNLKQNGSNLEGSYQDLKNTLTGTDWKSEFKLIISMTKSVVADKLAGRLIADPLCRAVFPKYMMVDDVDEYLKACGVEAGMDGMFFGESSLLSNDGYTINVVVEYCVNLKALTFGMYDDNVYIKQTACTAAWVHYDDTTISQEVEYTGDTESAESYWNLNATQRGKMFVDELKNKGGYGVGISGKKGYDIYDESSNTFTEVHSISVYKSKVTTVDEDGNYTLNEAMLKTYIRQYVREAENNTANLTEGKTFKLTDGSEKTVAKDPNYRVVLVFPAEASGDYDAQIKKIIDEMETDIQVNVQYEMNEKTTSTTPEQSESQDEQKGS